MILYNNIIYYTASEIAKKLSAKKHNIRRWIRKGLIPSISIGTKRYVAETEIDRLFIPAQKEG